MDGLALYPIRKRVASDYGLRPQTGKLRFEVLQQPAKFITRFCIGREELGARVFFFQR
jgi:hypothetical protein